MTFLLSKAINAAYFDKACEIAGPVSWHASRWGSEEDQFKRFNQIQNMLNIQDNSSVLDVGCGQGSFWSYLKTNLNNIEYKGIDASPKMVEYARAKVVPTDEPEVIFLETDFLDFEDKKYDYVIANGIFSVEIFEDSVEQYQYVEAILSKMIAMSNIGFFVNFLSTETPADFRHPEFFYYKPFKVMRLFDAIPFKYDHTLFEYEFAVSGLVR